VGYKSNGEYEQIKRTADLNQKTCLFTDFCFEQVKEGVFPPNPGDRARYYSWAQVIIAELAKLPKEERDYIILSPHKGRTYSIGEIQPGCGDWMQHDVGFCKERTPIRGINYV
jgi:hypothetical protein